MNLTNLLRQFVAQDVRRLLDAHLHYVAEDAIVLNASYFTFQTIFSLGRERNRGRKLINKLVINKLGKYKFFHVGKSNSHPRKNEKINLTVINFLHYFCVFSRFLRIFS